MTDSPNPIANLSALAHLVSGDPRIPLDVVDTIQSIILRVRDGIDEERAERRRVVECLEFKIRDLEGNIEKLSDQLETWQGCRAVRT